ncbi:MAG: anti-sigma factor family protein [Chitinophagaceae bacterium]
MIITRNNYEEFFILYMDNELSSDDRRQVELFVNENPDLQEELNLLMQTQLVPDSSFVFEGKERLLKTPAGISIDTSNYEEWLLSYTDNELSAEQKIAVERFIANHPAAKAELELLQKTKLQPEAAIVFGNKEILYRREEKVKVIGIRWRRIAVAAALLLAVGTTALLVLNNNKDNREEIASVNIEQKKNIQKIPVLEQPDQEAIVTNPQAADNTNGKKETIEISNPLAKEKKRVDQKGNPTPYSPGEVKQNDAVVAGSKEKKNMNNLPQPVHNPNMNRNTERDNPIAKMDPVEDPLTNFKETNRIPSVTPNSTQPLDNVITAASKVSVDPVDEERPGRKNKLRGFFRKVTRTFEKNTNIKATDDEDRLLLGGLAIKL